MIHEYDLAEYVDLGRCTMRQRRTLSDLTLEELERFHERRYRRPPGWRTRQITSGFLCSGCGCRECICNGEQLKLLPPGENKWS